MTAPRPGLPAVPSPTLPTGVEDAATEICATALLFRAIVQTEFADPSDLPPETRVLLQNTADALAQICRDAAAAQKSLSRLGIWPTKE